MPGEFGGKPVGPSYLYAVSVPVADADAFYQKAMTAAGWSLVRRETGQSPMFGGPSVVLDFTRSGVRANVMLVFATQEQYTMVLLTLIR